MKNMNRVLDILKERWRGKDMETYFQIKSKEFYVKLKEETKNLKK